VTDFETISNTVNARFKTEIEDALSVDVAYDNFPYEPTAGTKWIRFAVLPERAFQAEMGGTKRWHLPGLAVASIFLPLDTGHKVALEISDSIVTAFRSQTVSAITYRTPTVTNIGRTPDGAWHQTDCSIPFYAQDVV
jgi:hypothetical protein